MPIRLLNDRYLAVEKFDPAIHPVAAITGSSVLETGIDAWVELNGVQASITPSVQRRLFRVPIRALRPGPTLGPRDPDVMAWIRRWDAADGLDPADGWEGSVVVAEQRWAGRTEPEAYAKVQARLAEKRQEIARLDAQDEAARCSRKSTTRREVSPASSSGAWSAWVPWLASSSWPVWSK